MSPRTSLPAPQTLLPHRPPMLLLEEILRWEPGRIVCRAELGPDHPFLAPGGAGAPSALCAELLAQAAGLEHGLGLPQGVEPQAGLLVRIASLLLHQPVIPLGACLEIDARLEAQRGPLASYRGEIRIGAQPVAECRLSVYRSPAV